MEDRSIELTWLGKPARDAIGVTPGRFEIVERVDPRPTERQGSLPFESEASQRERGLLVRGDNLVALESLCSRSVGPIDLVYIDPPYATGLSYYSQTGIGDGDRAIDRHAYRDDRVGGMAGYLDAMYRRLAIIRELLADDGHLFLHCDWRANSMLRLVLDEVFGPSCFRNEIIWRRAPNLGRQAASKQLGRVIDSIFVYSKSPASPFPGPVPRRRAEVALDRKGKPKGAKWDPERELYFTTAPRGDYTDDSIEALRAQGRVYESASGTVYIKYFLTKGEDGRWYKEQPVDALWDDYEVRPLRHRPKSEDMSYDTQKPEGLLERIIGWASEPGDLVADFYAGSGTTAAVAAKMGRRWLACDLGRAAIEITRRRMLDLAAGQPIAPFDIATVEPEERLRWEGRLGDEAAHAALEALGAEPRQGRWGERDGALVYAAIGGPVGEADVSMTCAEGELSAGERLILLAFDWAADPPALRRAAGPVQLEQRTLPMELIRGASRRALRIPERPEVELEVVRDEGDLRLRLAGVKTEDGGEEPWADRVDAWMVDASGGEVFEPSWRSYRSRGDRDLDLETAPLRLPRGVHDLRVRVITVFGDEITRRIRVEC